MGNTDPNARLIPGRYTWSVAIVLGPPRPGENSTDTWAGTADLKPGATVRDALQLITHDVAGERGVAPELVNIVSYALDRVG